MRCPASFSGAHEPVLFVHGTAGRSEDHWALGYQKILPDLGFDVCTVRLPDLALADIQTATEYVVHAVRAIAAKSGKKVDVVGYSQGGLEPRWAVKYWLDVQARGRRPRDARVAAPRRVVRRRARARAGRATRRSGR